MPNDFIPISGIANLGRTKSGCNPCGPALAAFGNYALSGQNPKHVGDILHVNPATVDAAVAQNLVAPQANPIAVNQDPPVPGKGQPIAVVGSSGSTGVPTTDVNRQVSGTVPGTSVTIRNPA
jgi:hypothetical protein